MKRRSLLGHLAFLAILPIGCGALAVAPRPRAVVFWIAGVRFQQPAPQGLRPGDTVTVSFTAHDGEPAYAVTTDDGAMLGYVPKALVPSLVPVRRLAGTLVTANRYAVPWKRYRVAVSDQPAKLETSN